MRFSDFLIYEALRENNRALHLFARDRNSPGDSAVRELDRIAVRLQSFWLLLRNDIERREYESAKAGLENIRQALACRLDRLTLGATVAALSEGAPSEKSREAALLIAERVDAPGPDSVRLMAPRELIADGFQAESRRWRNLDRDSLSAAGLLAGYRRSYRRGRRAGLRALEEPTRRNMERWRHWACMVVEQLELIRSALGAETAGTGAHFRRLFEVLQAHEDLISLRASLQATEVSQKQKNRVAALIDLRLRYARERAAKLYPNCYRYAPRRYADSLARDTQNRDFAALLTAVDKISA